MSSVLHPVGPEPEQTYWIRRAIVLGSLLVLLALVIALVVNATSSGSVIAANPSPPPVTAPPAADDSPSSAPSAQASSTPKAKAKATTKATTKASPSPSASRKPAAAPKAKAKASVKPKPQACDPGELRATLTGRQALKPKQATTFTLSLINGSDSACVIRVDPDRFELKIYSGTDRIWSTDDCATAVKKTSTNVKVEDAVEWKMLWNGRRSAAGCEDRPEVPKPGTYFATAQLKGAEPVQLRMILRG